MVEEVLDPDLRLVVGDLVAEELADRVAGGELALALELEDGGGGELFTRGRDLEERARPVGGLGVVGVPVALGEDGLPLLRHEDGPPEAPRGRALHRPVEVLSELAVDDRLVVLCQGGERDRDEQEGRPHRVSR